MELFIQDEGWGFEFMNMCFILAMLLGYFEHSRWLCWKETNGVLSRAIVYPLVPPAAESIDPWIVNTPSVSYSRKISCSYCVRITVSYSFRVNRKDKKSYWIENSEWKCGEMMIWFFLYVFVLSKIVKTCSLFLCQEAWLCYAYANVIIILITYIFGFLLAFVTSVIKCY